MSAAGEASASLRLTTPTETCEGAHQDSKWDTYFNSPLRFVDIEMAIPGSTDYHWTCRGCVHPGYNERDLVMWFEDRQEGMTAWKSFELALDPEAAKDLHAVLTAYLKWAEMQP